MTPTPMQKSTVVDGVYINAKIAKQASSGKTYWMFESSIGTLVSFSEKAANQLDKSDTTVYSLALQEPKPGFKYQQIVYVQGAKSEPRPTPPPPAPKPVAQHYEEPKQYAPRRYSEGVDKSAVYEEKDFRISKLSIFSSIVNLMASKTRADANFAKKDISSLILEAVEYANIVTQEFIYGVPKSSMVEPVSAPKTEPEPIYEEKDCVPEIQKPIYTPQVQQQPMQYVQQPAPAYVAPTPVHIPIATPTSAPVRYSQPIPTQQPLSATQATIPQVTPVTVTVPQQHTPIPAQSTIKQDAQKLFGAGTDLEARMAERLRQLTNSARKA